MKEINTNQLEKVNGGFQNFQAYPRIGNSIGYAFQARVNTNNNWIHRAMTARMQQYNN